MKIIFGITTFIFASVFVLQCKVKQSAISCEKLELRKFDLDSNILLLIPHDWDSIVNMNKYLTEEYRYSCYISKRDFKEGVIVDRKRFITPQTSLLRLKAYFKNYIETSYRQGKTHLLKEDFFSLNGKEICKILYSVKGIESPCYVAEIFFINKDSSQTNLFIETNSKDTGVAYNRMNCVLNSFYTKAP